jgi:hypothetical protein
MPNFHRCLALDGGGSTPCNLSQAANHSIELVAYRIVAEERSGSTCAISAPFKRIRSSPNVAARDASSRSSWAPKAGLCPAAARNPNGLYVGMNAG